MASAAIKGSGQFTYTPQGGSPTTFTLAVPLLIAPAYAFQATRQRTRWESWNSDLTEREVFVLGSAVYEIVGQIRFDDQPAALRSMLVEAIENDIEVTYSPDGGGTSYPCSVVDLPGHDRGEWVKLDTQLFGQGRWMATVRLRRTDGSTFDALFT